MHDDNRLEGHRIQENSPAIDAGKFVKNNGVKDFWENSLSFQSTDIGAYDTNSYIFAQIQKCFL